MGIENNPGNGQRKNDGRKNREGEGSGKPPADGQRSDGFEGAKMPDFGEKTGEGHYVLSTDEGVVSAGSLDVHETGMIGSHVLGPEELGMMGVRDEKGAFLALKGDSGSAKTSVGYNLRYASGYDRLFGKQSNN